MSRFERERTLHVVERPFEVLSRQCIHEVEVQVVDSRTPDLVDRALDVARRMNASQRLQACVIETLCAKRHAINSGDGVIHETTVLDGAGVGFERDLDV